MAVEADAGVQVRRDQKRRWLFLLVFISLLLLIFHQGFFFYAALVVGITFIAAWFLAMVNLLGLKARREVSETLVEIGSTITVKLYLQNNKNLPVSWLMWDDQLEPGLVPKGASTALLRLSPQEKEVQEYELTFDKRGLYRIGPAVLETGGPFGLVRRFLIGNDAVFVTVLPRTIRLEQGWPLGRRPIHEMPARRSLVEDPARFVGVREYRMGDSQRRIHWRATARAGKLQSRVYEPSVLEGVLLVVDMHLTSYPGLEGLVPFGSRHRQDRWMRKRQAIAQAHPLTELAVTAAASLADYAISGGQKVGLLSNGADAVERYPNEWSGLTFVRMGDALAELATTRKVIRFRPVEVPSGKGAVQRHTLRTALARLIPSEGLELAGLLIAKLPRLPRDLVMAVITPALTSALATAIGSLRRSGIDVMVILLSIPGAKGPEVVPSGLVVYSISNEADIHQLGLRRM